MTNFIIRRESAPCIITNAIGQFVLKVFELSAGNNQRFDIVTVATKSVRQNALLRINSACITAEIFADDRCDCGWQLRRSLELMAHDGNGLLIYASCDEGRGAGILNKVNSLNLMDHGASSSQAFVKLGLPVDSRSYGYVGPVLKRLEISSVRCLTNNPKKVAALKSLNVQVTSCINLVLNDGERLRQFFLDKVLAQHSQIDMKKYPIFRWAPRDKEVEGKLIAICGHDGAGKTSQVELLEARLRERGKKVLVTRQPTEFYRENSFIVSYLENGGTESDGRAAALIAAADRIRHVQGVVVPALREGMYVITDRYVFSSLALFALRGVPIEFVANINAGIPEPDIAILLHLPAAKLFERLLARDKVIRKYEERSIDAIDRTQREYFEMCPTLVPVNGDQAVDDVSGEIWMHLEDRRLC